MIDAAFSRVRYLPGETCKDLFTGGLSRASRFIEGKKLALLFTEVVDCPAAPSAYT